MTIARPTSVRDLLGAVSVVCFVYAMTSWIVLLPSLFYRFPCAISAIFSVLALGYLILWQVSSLFRFVVSIFVLGFWAPLFRFMDLFRRSFFLPTRPVSHVWCEDMMHYFNATAVQYQEPDGNYVPLLTGERCLYLFPHRSWADFFISRYLCDGRASNLARELIKWVFLPFWFACSHDDSLWFFDNNRTRDSNNFDRNAYIKELDQFLDSMFHRSVCGGLIVFPEGRRNLEDRPLPLKHGLLYYAYSRNLPVQIIMTRGAERIVNETKLAINFGERVYFRYGPVVRPAGLSKAEFVQTIERLFIHEFDRITAYQEQEEKHRFNRCITNYAF